MIDLVDIFIKSYSKDFWLLEIALKTITKNVTGYNNLVLLIPEHEKHDFDTRRLPDRTLIHYVNEYGDGYLFQQVCKIQAYKYCNAGYIMFSDSDCFFDHPINLADFIPNPEILYTDYNEIPDAKIWKKPTEDFLKEPVYYEFMRRNCLIYHRDTLIEISKYAPGIEQTIMNSERFSEFNAIGAFAFKYERDRYTFINTNTWTYTPPKAIQVWSHCSKEPGADELHLREYIKVLETIIKSLV